MIPIKFVGSVNNYCSLHGIRDQAVVKLHVAPYDLTARRIGAWPPQPRVRHKDVGGRRDGRPLRVNSASGAFSIQVSFRESKSDARSAFFAALLVRGTLGLFCRVCQFLRLFDAQLGKLTTKSGHSRRLASYPKSRHWLSTLGCPLCANSGHSEVRSHPH